MELVPPVVDQVTAASLAPVTAAVNCCVPSARIEADVGEMVSDTVGRFTLTRAEADLVLSATLEAVTT